jgi:hypothetical protein
MASCSEHGNKALVLDFMKCDECEELRDVCLNGMGSLQSMAKCNLMLRATI